MSVLSEQKIHERLSSLTGAADSIQTNAQWILHHCKPATVEIIADAWLKEISREPASSKMVALLYLANDVIQNGRKKLPEISRKFLPALETAYRCIRKKPHDNSVMECIRRLIDVWESRSIFNQAQLTKLETAAGMKKKPIPDSSDPLQPATPRAEFGLEKVEELEKKTREIVSLLHKLEDAPSCDEVIRGRIASFPESTANTSFLCAVKNESDARAILKKTEEAGPICKAYCDSLATEVMDRRSLQNHLAELVEAVKLVAANNSQLIEGLHKTEDHVRKSIKEVQTAYESLPDLNEMLMDAGPLPSLGELFND